MAGARPMNVAQPQSMRNRQPGDGCARFPWRRLGSAHASTLALFLHLPVSDNGDLCYTKSLEYALWRSRVAARLPLCGGRVERSLSRFTSVSGVRRSPSSRRRRRTTSPGLVCLPPARTRTLRHRSRMSVKLALGACATPLRPVLAERIRGGPKTGRARTSNRRRCQACCRRAQTGRGRLCVRLELNGGCG